MSEKPAYRKSGTLPTKLNFFLGDQLSGGASIGPGFCCCWFAPDSTEMTIAVKLSLALCAIAALTSCAHATLDIAFGRVQYLKNLFARHRFADPVAANH